uniref:Uncharacterized protein n=1 Tax=Ciona savignyi TaxID=51511 RepID=H2Z3U5_CIOSA
MKIDLEAEHDPPAFINSRIKAKINQLEADGTSFESEIGKLSTAIDDKLAQSRPASPAPVAQPKPELPVLPAESANELKEDSELLAAATFMHSENPEIVADKLLSPKRGNAQVNKSGMGLRGATGPTPTAHSLGLRTSVADCMATHSKDGYFDDDDNNNGELDLTGIDDNEIDK